LLGTLIGTQCEVELHITQISLRNRVFRIDHDRHFERTSGLVELVAFDVQRGKVIPGLWQLGKRPVI